MTKIITDEMIPISEFAKMKNIDATKVIDMIRDGFYEGRKVGEDWFVVKSELQNDVSDNNDDGSSLNLMTRIPIALLVSPGIGLLIGYILSLGTSSFEGGRAYVHLYLAIIFTVIFFFTLLAVRNKRAHSIIAAISVIGWIVMSFA